jgi:squalene-hopene/tetraprenyl-beta-curcumene cyclase
MQPSSGGYLEAVPLTSFVLMCLADIGLGDHPVAVRAVDFLLASRLHDGSLPIDTNLATWTTSLSISALDYGRGQVAAAASQEEPVGPTALRWLLSCQHWSEHPFTGAKPGGWGWSNLSGAVPDADDTPAALLALARWSSAHRGASSILDMQTAVAATQGLRWLLSLQNRDGGWPTFCRGWGTLPFDRSGSDLTAHALRALEAWRQRAEWLEPDRVQAVLAAGQRATERGFRFLEKRQNPDGSWFPLWFGNQDRADEENPVYGTAKVLLAYADYGRCDAAFERGVAYLIGNQNADGGWGGGPSVPYRVRGTSAEDHGSSVEETGFALEALLTASRLARGSTAACQPTIMRGLRWMVAAVEDDCLLTSWPIGFYFAKLWYHERLYPIIASTSALGAAVERTELWLESP